MTTSLIVIWALYAFVNLCWQLVISWTYRLGFLDALQLQDQHLHKFTVEYATKQSLTIGQAYRKISTIGMNVWALPITIVASVLAVVISYI